MFKDCLNLKTNAFPYQLEAIEKVRELEYSAIFHEQGLGKTKIAIDTILYWLAAGDVDSVIVVAKRGLVPNWIDEFKDHTHIIPSIVGNKSSENYYAFISTAPILITHYEALKKECERIKLYCEGQRVAIVLDESHKIKNPTAAVTLTLHSLRTYFKKRMILTGTPAANRPYDIWSQIYFLDGGDALGSDYETFKHETDIDFVPNGGDQKEYERSLGAISKLLSPFSVRETKKSGVIALPEKIETNIETEWETLQLEKYVEARDDLSLVLVRDGEVVEDDTGPILKRLVRLVQLASNPALVDESYTRIPGKIEWLKDLVGNIAGRDEKVIVWSSFNKNMRFIRDHLSEYGCRLIFGDMSIEERYISLSNFKTNPDVRVLIATPGAAKEGLTLTVANNVIFYDRSFSLDDYLQSQDRIHRIKQEKECNVYNLIMPGSIDEWVDQLIVAKTMAARFSQGDIVAEDFRNRMNFDFREGLREVLGINA